jgi:hypothetical protein
MRRHPLALLLTLILAPAAHAQGWTPTVDLLPPGGLADYNVQALGAAGDAAVLWADYSGTTFVLHASVRAPGEPFGAPVPLAPSDVASREADVAIDATGTTIVAYVVTVGSESILYARVRPRGGAFSEPIRLSPEGTQPREPRIAMNAAGLAAVAWLDTVPSVDIAHISVRQPGGSFEPDTELAPVISTVAEVGVDGGGDIVVSYRDDGSPQHVTVMRRAAGSGAFGPPVGVSPDSHTTLTNHQLEVDEAGHAALTWTTNNRVWAAYAPPGGAFGAADDLGAFTNAAAPEAAIDAAGNALLAWQQGDHAVLARRPAGGAAGDPETLGGPGSFPEGIEITPDGAFAVLIWDIGPNLEAAVGSFAGPFTPGASIATNGSDPALDIQPNGDALVSWIRPSPGPTQQVPQWRAHDRNAPALGLTFPETATVGHPVTMTASMLDTWSPFTVAWSFGDGGTSTERTPTHTFAAPGSYEVGLTATDAFGKQASAARRITVSATPITTIPVLSGLKLKPERFRALRKGGPLAGTTAAKRGTRVRYTLDVAARVIFRVQRKRGKKFKLVKGSFGVDSLAGANQFRFSGRLRGRALRPGRYRLVARPQNGAGKGTTVRKAFRVVRR